jgi:hypothetical protein
VVAENIDRRDISVESRHGRSRRSPRRDVVLAVCVKGAPMSNVLDVVGLLALVIGGFLIAPWVGFGVFGSGCLWVSWAMTRRTRLEAEARVNR